MIYDFTEEIFGSNLPGKLIGRHYPGQRTHFIFEEKDKIVEYSSFHNSPWWRVEKIQTKLL